MADEIPHIAFPLQLVDGGLLVVEQDSADHVAQCVEVAARTEEGWRIDAPDFGIPVPLSHVGPVDVEELRAALVRSEPRARLVAERVEEVGDLRAEHIRILIDEEG